MNRTQVATASTQQILKRRGTRVYLKTDADYPIRDSVPQCPEVLLAEGDQLDIWERPRVAIVGTRSATPPGLVDAHNLARILAAAGIVVISGLARGIDAAAHRGAIEAGGHTVGVVATGLDYVYPANHKKLYEQVRTCGALVSECEFGIPPERYRFPIRNRIIAALADVVVVVEATLKGGARITAEHALDYGRTVLAIPGSRRNPAAEGCNHLIADGAHPLLEPSDVFLALGLEHKSGWDAPQTPLSEQARSALQALQGEPCTVDQLAGRTGLSAAGIAQATRELEKHGRISRARGLVWAI